MSDRPFATMLLNAIDSLIEQHFENELEDVIGLPDSTQIIEIVDVTRAVNTINSLRKLKSFVQNGKSDAIFANKDTREVFQCVVEVMVDMEQ